MSILDDPHGVGNRAFKAFRLALGFLTILPVGAFPQGVSEDDLAESRFAYPAVGLAMGLLLAMVSALLTKFGASPAPASWVLLATAAILSGGLHLDGVADTFDGLFLAGSAERRLAAMKDSRVGSYGVAGVVLVLLGKFAALEVLTSRERIFALIGAFAASRTLVLMAAGSADYARPDGTGRAVIDAASPNEALAAAGSVLLLGAVVGGARGFVASAMALGVTGLWVQLSRRNLGGITGDILGAVVETSELAFLLGFGLFRG